MVKGFDCGYDFSKDNTGFIFKSAYSLQDTSVMGGKKIIIDGTTYYVGVGSQISDMDKTDSGMNKVCLLYNMLATKMLNTHIVVGLPVAQYRAQKEKLKETILKYNECLISDGEEEYIPNIKDVLVTMQGVSSLYTLGQLDGEYIVIDVGGLTVDISLVKFGIGFSSLIKYDTLYSGIRTLYGDFMELVNNHFNLKLGNEYGENLIRTGKILYNGEEHDLNFTKDFLNSYVDKISEEIKLKYPYKTTPIYIVGGGALLLSGAMKKRFGDVKVIPDPQFANAIGNYKIGCMKFKE